MKQAIIVHGWGGNPSGDWLPWLKEKLKSESFEVVVPEMPDTFRPTIDDWVSALQNIAYDIDGNTILIGHSIGCQTILRFVEKLPADIKIGKIILVAAWLHLTDETWDKDYTPKIAKQWLETPIDFDKVKSHCDNIVCIQSDNDPFVPVTDAEIFKEKLNAKIVFIQNAGHISAESGFTKLPGIIQYLGNLED